MTTMDLYIFDEYPPKSLVLPGYYDPDFHDIVDTASNLLDRFSPSEIVSAVRHFDEYIYRHTSDNQTSPDDWQTKGDPYGDYCAGIRTGFLVQSAETGRDLNDAFGCSIQPHEAFAMAALAVIAMAVREESKLEEAGDMEELYRRLGRYAIEGSRLSYAANILQLNPHVALPVEKYRKSIASKGGLAKREKYSPLRQAIYSAWTEGQHQERSNKEAARRIWEALPDELKLTPENKPILTPDDPEATVARWIAEFKRGKTP
jgi:hypothetical protein